MKVIVYRGDAAKCGHGYWILCFLFARCNTHAVLLVRPKRICVLKQCQNIDEYVLLSMLWSEAQNNNSSVCAECQSSCLASFMRVICHDMDTKLKIESESQEDINSLFYEVNDKKSLQDGGSDRSNCSLVTEGSNVVASRILPYRFAVHHDDAIPSDSCDIFLGLEIRTASIWRVLYTVGLIARAHRRPESH